VRWDRGPSGAAKAHRTLSVQISYRRADGPLNLLFDSTDLTFLGDGEWQARKHDVQGRRQRRKVHLDMDTATSDIRAVDFPPAALAIVLTCRNCAIRSPRVKRLSQ